MRPTKLLQNKSGFTLIELMVAMVIMLIGLLGLLQSVNIAMEYNLKNQMRNDVVRIAQESMNNMRSQPFDSVFTPMTTVTLPLRNLNKTYTVNRTVSTAGTASSKKYQVDVTWMYKNVPTTHSVLTVRSR